MNTLPLDPEIAALAAEASVWLTYACGFALMRGMTLAEFLAECILVGEATACGYLATASRASGARHVAYASVVVDPPVRETLADRVQREVDAWGTRKAVA